jgi:hypothetical protein
LPSEHIFLLPDLALENKKVNVKSKTKSAPQKAHKTKKYKNTKNSRLKENSNT